MKKKLLATFSGTLVLVLSVWAFAACGEASVNGAKLLKSEEKLVVIEATDSQGSLDDALKAFAEKGELTYETEEGQYGAFITAVNGYRADGAKNEFYAIYTTLTTYLDVSYSSTEYGSYEYEGKTLGSASYGASGLPLVEGEIYVLTVATY